MTLRSSNVLVVVGLVALTGLTAARLAQWQTPISVWDSHAPSPRVLNNRGAELAREGRLEESRAAYLQALEAAADPRWSTENAEHSRDIARLNLAILSATAQQYDEALGWLAQMRHRPSLVTHLESQWRAEQRTGQAFTASYF